MNLQPSTFNQMGRLNMDKNRNLGGLVIGIILVAVGAISLFGSFFNFMSWNNLWPLLITAVGLAFFIGMLFGGKSLGGLAVPGSIIVTVGLILFVLNAINRWEAWSYAWALIIVGIGAGILINGYWSDQPNLRKQGLVTIRSGLTLFLIFGVLMEFIFSATGVNRWGNLTLWGILLAILGLYLLITRILHLGIAEGEHDLFWPVLMIGAGAVASLAYLGLLPEGNLSLLLNLWPLLLIAAGLGILFRNSSPWFGALLGVLVVAAIFVVAFAGGALGLRSGPIWPFETGLVQIGDVERVIGSGNVITENRTVSDFNRVRLEIPADLEIQQGSAEALTVSGEDNLLPLLLTEVSGGELAIRFKPFTNARPTEPIKITLTVKDLEELDLSSSGDVLIHPITTGDFKLGLYSSGNIEIEEIQAEQVRADISSSGEVLVKGSARQLDLNISSSGSFQAEDLQVQDAEVNLSSSGEATIWVLENLDVAISSSGTITYYGNPRIKQNNTSSGRLISRGEK
jgi:MFS family permease